MKNLLKTPISELSKDELREGFRLLDEAWAANRKANENYRMDYSKAKIHIIKDDLGGVQGMLNHADGKIYDSKSAYYKSLKASGHVVQEAGMDKPKKFTYNADGMKKDIKSVCDRLGINVY